MGPDGALWFTEEGTSKIGRMTASGVLTNEFDVPTTASSVPCTDPAFVPPLDQITTGPDGALWFTMPRDNKIGRITAGGVLDPPAGYSGLIAASQPEAITVGPDLNLWVTQLGINGIARITTGGGLTQFPAGGIGPSDITQGPDGALWFTAAFGGTIGRMTTGGAVTNHFPVTAGSGPSGITQGPGGLWFTESNANAIGRITTDGQVSEFPGTLAGPSAIALGRDGALWFTESEGNSIGRITANGVITNHFAIPTPGSEPSDVTAGPDGALWFTEFSGNKIGRIDTALPAPAPPPPAPVVVAPPAKKKTRACKVPKVKRLSVKKAKKKLKNAKCRYRIRGKGYVVSTRPKAGKRTTKRVLVKAKPRRARRSARAAAFSTVRR